MNENYYLLLNLPIENFVSGQEALKTLETSVKKWRASNNTTERDKAEKYEKPIKEAIIDSAEWQKQYDEAKKMVVDAINSWIMVSRGKGYITPNEISEKARSLRVNAKIKSYKVSEKFIINIINAKNVSIRDEEEDAKISSARLEDFKPKSEIRFKQALTSLEQLSCESFYQFLEKYQVNTKFAFTEDTNATQCVNAAKVIEEDWKDKKENAEKSAVNTLCTAIILHFAKPDDDMCQAEYNKIIVYTKIKAIFAELNGNFKGSNNKILDENSREIYIQKIMNFIPNRADAESILLNYCREHEISARRKMASVALCPFCRSIFEKHDGKTPDVCPVCHKSFIVACPKCKKEANLAETGTCNNVGCGFNFEQYSKLKHKCDEAREYVKILNFEFASSRIDEVEKAWRDFPELVELKDELETKKRDFGKLIDSLNRYVAENRFQTAKREYLNIKKLISGYNDSILEDRINNALSMADEFYRKSRLEKDNNIRLQLLIKTTEIVADHADALSDLGAIEPEPVKNLKCRVPEGAEYVDLTWQSDNQEDTAIYVILRKEYSLPVSYEDGRIAQISEKAYCDKTLRTGIPYFYSVYSTRGNNRTAICHSSEPVIVFPAIRDVNIVPDETSISVSWSTDTGNMDVEVFRCDSPDCRKYGEGMAILGAGKNSFEDIGLEVGRKYYYNIFLTKTVNAKKLISEPLSINASPVKIGNRIEFEIEQGEDRLIINLITTPDSDENIEFYTSPKPIIIADDGVVSVASLTNELKLTPLRVSKESPTRYSFNPPENSNGYVYSVSVKGDTAVIGHEDYFENLEMIEVKSKRSDGINLFIELEEFPKNANTMTIVYRHDKYPREPGESGSMKFMVNRKDYNSRNISMQYEKDTCYYICGFVRGGNGHSMVFRTMFTSQKKIKIYYYISKLLFTRKIVFSADKEIELPELIIKYKQNSRPYNSREGSILKEISSDGTKSRFEFKIELPSDMPKSRDIYYNVFLKDESLNSKYQLMLNTEKGTDKLN